MKLTAVQEFALDSLGLTDADVVISASDDKGYAARSDKAFEEIFGHHISWQPICVLDKGNLGFEACRLGIRRVGDKNYEPCVYGYFYEYKHYGDIPHTREKDEPSKEVLFGRDCFYQPKKREVSLTLKELAEKTTRVFIDYDAWVKELRKGLSIVGNTKELHEELKNSEKNMNETKERFQRSVETWIQDFYMYSIKRGNVVILPSRMDGANAFHVSEFVLNEDTQGIEVVGEMLEWRDTVKYPIGQLILAIVKVYKDIAEYAKIEKGEENGYDKRAV